MKSSTTIFKQLILNIILPVVAAIFLLGALNYYHTQSILIEGNETKNELISNEIKNILKFQDYSFDIIEDDLNTEIEAFSQILTEYVFKNTDSIETADLLSIREQIGMNASLQDIYIINTNGIVVNTTFKRDLGLDFFSFGEEHKKHLLDILKERKFVSERFTLETTTKKLKKYTYQPTLDGKYIVEVGVYSGKATRIIESFKEHLNGISKRQKDIVSVEMFIGADNPISFNKNAEISEKNKEFLLRTFKEKQKQTYESEDENGIPHSFQFIYMERKSTSLYKGAVIRIITDLTHERAVLRNDLIQLLVIFILTIIVVIVLIYNKTKIITKPLKKLVDNVNRITDGNLNERADVEGNNEIAKLSKQFNVMVENLEDSYSNLERKVIERTAEIQKQKDEIEEQKKHITDSIHYAKRIQNAILPSNEYAANLLPNSFLLYKPKDIVSGDFYWMRNLDDKALFAAVDCTGHGVPGAFMSIVGHNHLNHAVNVSGARRPADILNALNQGVTSSLGQQQGENAVKDGMDIALCSLDYKTNKLEFSGAYNPVYLIRDREIIQFKGDKFPVGSFLGEELKTFKNIDIQLQKGDTFYIFSDGYPDQFGGPKGKKFKYKQFRELLLSIQDKEMGVQKVILDETIESWRGQIEQLDDILIIGVRINE
ncbi:MAG: SpoIIE family protein phosphatase [Flavobacteriales bacterium]|nr:SpoIIE family protein phosphatase [Flavobacteriales bacterium]